jgi:SAM-dependent methyltransferase
MESYTQEYAALYDVFYGDKPYAEEALFVHNCLKARGPTATRSVLELACGTGSHALALERHGYEMFATDISEGMLRVAREKATAAGSKVSFSRQDMRTLDLGNRAFDAAICLFDAIGFVQTNEAVQESLRRVHRHLRPGGLFIFDFWHAAAMLRAYDRVRVRRFPMNDGEVVRVSETTLDCFRQLCAVKYTVHELAQGGTFRTFTETQVNRYFLCQEMAGWLTSCHFAPVAWYNGFTENTCIDENTWHIVAVARSVPT